MNTTFLSLLPAFGQYAGLFALLFAAALVLLHILFAICIADDITWLRRQSRPIIVLTPMLWILSALLLGLVVMAFYWLCHYSRFNRKDL